MPDVDDAGKTPSPAEQPKANDSETASNDDWHKRYNGQTGVIERQRKEIEKLQNQYESELADLRGKTGSAETTKKDLEKQLDDARRERDVAVNKLTITEKAAALKGKYPNLDDVLLASVDKTEFTDEAAYDTYLKTLNDKLGVTPPQQVPPTPPEVPENEFVGYRSTNYLDQLAGILPNTPNQTGHQRGQGKRTSQQIQAEMDRLDTKTRDGQQKFDVLLRELDSVLG